jgi:hypothetical protein
MAATQMSEGEIQRAKIGDYGSEFISGTDPVTGSFWAFDCVGATVFATGTMFNGATNPFGSQSFPALYQIRGNFSVIELVSGVGMAYKYR